MGAVSTANEDQVTVQAMRKLAIPCRHSPWAVWFDICKIAVKTAPTIAERTPYPRGSGLDREWEPNDRPGYALASDPLSPFALGGVVRHIKDRGQDRSHNSRADAIPPWERSRPRMRTK